MSLKTEEWAKTFKNRVGFPAGALPLIVVLGLVYLCGTTPSLVKAILKLAPKTIWLVHATTGFDRLLQNSSTSLETHDATAFTAKFVPMALMLALLIIPASGIRSFRASTPRPLFVTLGSFLAGLFALLALTWVGEVAVVVWRSILAVVHAIEAVVHAIERFFHWAAPVLEILGLIVIIPLAAAGIWFGLKALTKGRYWPRVGWIVGSVAIVVILIRFGWLNWLGKGLGVGARWVGHYLGIAVHWLQIALIILVVLLGIVALLGQIGRTVFLPIVAAGSAGKDSGKSSDLAAGIGIAFSLVLCGAALNRTFGVHLTGWWHHSSLLSWMPAPIDLYRTLMPAAAKHIVGQAFVGYNPLVDCVLLAVTAVIGIGGLLFTGGVWGWEGLLKVLSPVLVGIAAMLPLLIIWIVVKKRITD